MLRDNFSQSKMQTASPRRRDCADKMALSLFVGFLGPYRTFQMKMLDKILYGQAPRHASHRANATCQALLHFPYTREYQSSRALGFARQDDTLRPAAPCASHN